MAFAAKRLYRLRVALRLWARDTVKWALMASSGWWTTASSGAVHEQGKKHLVLLRPDGIGDFVLFARNLHRLRALYPASEWHVTLVGNIVWQGLAENLNLSVQGGWFDLFLPVDRSRLMREGRYRRYLAARLKGLNCDEMIYPVISRDVWGSIMAAWVPAPHKVAPEGDDANMIRPFKRWYDRIFSDLFEVSGKGEHEVVQTDRLFRALGCRLAPDDVFIPLQPTMRMHEEAAKLLVGKGLPESARYSVVFPGASQGWKRWPSRCFIEWGRAWSAEQKGWIVICGGPDEVELGAEVARGIGDKALNLAGLTSLVSLAGVLSGAQCCLGNDTAAVHISAAFGKPTTCVLGGGHWGRFWPYGDPALNRTLSHQMPCFGCNWECRFVGIPAPCIQLTVTART